MTNTGLSNSRPKRVLITNEADQLELESHSAAASSLKAARTYIKSFLEFSKAEPGSAITKDQLTGENCASYISAV